MLLTLILNVGLRMFPGASDRTTRRIETWAAAPPEGRYDPPRQERRVKVFFPWKAMLIGSLLLTVIVNAFNRG